MILEACGITRSFAPQKQVLSGIDLEIGEGECVALTGSNGSGKTTLLSVLATLLLPTRGDARICGFSLRKNASAVRARIGWMPANEGGFFSRLSGRENLELFGYLDGLSTSRIRESIAGWDRDLPISEALRTPLYLCSSGMRQAIALCRSLLRDPPLLLLDEPTRSLDPEAATAFWRTLREAARDRAVLFASHRETEWAELGTRRVHLSDGRLSALPAVSALSGGRDA